MQRDGTPTGKHTRDRGEVPTIQCSPYHCSPWLGGTVGAHAGTRCQCRPIMERLVTLPPSQDSPHSALATPRLTVPDRYNPSKSLRRAFDHSLASGHCKWSLRWFLQHGVRFVVEMFSLKQHSPCTQARLQASTRHRAAEPSISRLGSERPLAQGGGQAWHHQAIDTHSRCDKTLLGYAVPPAHQCPFLRRA